MALTADERIILGHQTTLRQIRERVRAYASTRWLGLKSWRDRDIDRFLVDVVPVILKAQKQTWQLTNSYLDAIARASGYAPLKVIPPMTGEALRGVSMDEVYRRPANSVYTALKQGVTIEEAVKLGAERLDYLVGTDMQLAKTRAYHARFNEDGRIIGYQRVINGIHTCALCQLASTQRYHREDLMPIHPGCDCSVAPIYGKADAGQVINQRRLDEIKVAAEKGGFTDTHAGGKDRAWTDLEIRQHGEYGPTLTWKDQDFTGSGDI